MPSRLVVTRETVREILGEAASQRPPSDVDDGIAAGAGGLEGASAIEAVASGGPPIGVVTVPAWRPGTEASVLPQTYRDVLEVPVDAGRPLRAKQRDVRPEQSWPGPGASCFCSGWG